MDDVDVRLETTDNIKSGTFNAPSGTEVSLSFDPLKTTVGIDYSRADSLSIKVAGELSLGSSALSLGLEGDASVLGKGSVSGTLTWNISNAVSAKADVKYGTAGASATATLTIRFA